MKFKTVALNYKHGQTDPNKNTERNTLYTKGGWIQCHSQKYIVFREGKKHSLLIRNEYRQKGLLHKKTQA